MKSIKTRRIEMKRFIYLIKEYIKDKVKSIVSYLRVTHEKLSLLDEETGTIPYLVFYQWLVEILAYGSAVLFIYADIFIITGWLKWLLMPITLGLARWLWLDLVSTTCDSIRGKR
jgi:hypothetical protein